MMGSDELLDLVLAGVESLLALDAAAVLAAITVGVDFSRVDWHTALDLNAEGGVRLLLAMAGWRNIHVCLHANDVAVWGSAPALSIGFLGALSAVLAPSARTLRLAATLPDGRYR